jgi:hypothetical protein
VPELTAIDTLMTPDDSMIKRAKSVNERFLKNVPSPPGFAGTPHMVEPDNKQSLQVRRD